MDFLKRFNQSQKVGQGKVFDSFFVWFCKSETTQVKNYIKQSFFQAGFVKMSPTLSKTRSTKIFSWIFKLNQPKSKIRSRKFFWV